MTCVITAGGPSVSRFLSDSSREEYNTRGDAAVVPFGFGVELGDTSSCASSGVARDTDFDLCFKLRDCFASSSKEASREEV